MGQLHVVGGRATRAEAARPYVVVVGIDFDAPAMKAANIAMRVAARHTRAELHLVGALAPPRAMGPFSTFATMPSSVARLHERLESFALTLEARESVRIVAHAVLGAPARSITDLARELGANLIVLGSAGATGIARFLFGSITATVRRHAECAVMTVEPPHLTRGAHGIRLVVAPT